jgi:hypothetical protein
LRRFKKNLLGSWAITNYLSGAILIFYKRLKMNCWGAIPDLEPHNSRRQFIGAGAVYGAILCYNVMWPRHIQYLVLYRELIYLAKCSVFVKGTVARDFRPSVFSSIRKSLKSDPAVSWDREIPLFCQSSPLTFNGFYFIYCISTCIHSNYCKIRTQW